MSQGFNKVSKFFIGLSLIGVVLAVTSIGFMVYGIYNAVTE